MRPFKAPVRDKTFKGLTGTYDREMAEITQRAMSTKKSKKVPGPGNATINHKMKEIKTTIKAMPPKDEQTQEERKQYKALKAEFNRLKATLE